MLNAVNKVDDEIPEFFIDFAALKRVAVAADCVTGLTLYNFTKP